MYPAIHQKDFYKADHRRQYPEGTTLVYSNFTPRKSRDGIPYVVSFGIQAFIRKYLIDAYHDTFFSIPKEVAVAKYKRRLDTSLGADTVPVEHIEALHDLGYLPLHIKALPEGSVVPIGIPVLTVRNTIPEFFWLTNDLETVLSCELWKPMTNAATAFAYYKVLYDAARKSSSNLDFVKWQGHDFSMRGMSGVDDAAASGAAHLLSFYGTDSIPGIDFLEKYYYADAEKEMIGGSVPATEHSVMCMGSKNDEIRTFERLLFKVYPDAPVLSIVSDTWSLSKVVTEFLPKLKERILARPGKLVVRPDSGDPYHILCGYQIVESDEVPEPGSHYRDTAFLVNGKYWIGFEQEITEFYAKGLIRTLWEIFGGTTNEKGYKELDSHIGAIYGDSITLERATRITDRLMELGFASTNVVFGIGSFTYQYVTRDTRGFAMKATYGEVEVMELEAHGPGVSQWGTYTQRREIWKDPETDDGTKKSAKGLLRVQEVLHPDSYGKIHPKSFVLHDQQTWDQEKEGALHTVFLNGDMTSPVTLEQVRKRLAEYLVF